ncbi:MAG: hypothetical protein D6732_01415 [Methanobacteriota archaeon]|nr:MAG: hypothetical protein D6732_01415 [Euryarchaeota archaeon]
MSETSSQTLLDFNGWRRAFGPALRVVGYTAAIYAVLVILVLIPASFVPAFYTGASAVVTILSFFGFVLSFFKVLDEQQNKGVIKLL